MGKKRARAVRDTMCHLHTIEDGLADTWSSHFKMKTQFKLTNKQTEFYNCLLDKKTQMAFVDGFAGTMKTYLAVYAGLELVRDEMIKNIVYIRSAVESADKSIGFLPGELDDKFSPYSIPLMEKVEEITDSTTARQLKNIGTIDAIPVNYTRGVTFKKTLVIIDEAQNMTRKELTTVLTRFGYDSKYVICGDTMQSDIKNNTGFADVYNAFNTEASRKKGIHCFKFGRLEIKRSPILKHICDVLGS